MADRLNPLDFGIDNIDRQAPEVNNTAPDIKALSRLRFDVVSDTTRTFGHKEATTFLELSTFEDERSVSDQHVQRLMDEMRLGSFNETNVVIAWATCKDKLYAINGQHTAWAIVYGPADYAIKVRTIHYRVTNEDQLRLLYSTFDRNKSRDDAHIVQVMAGALAMADGVWHSLLGRLSGAFKFWWFETEPERRRLLGSQLVGMINRDHIDLFQRVAKFYQSHHVKENRRLMRSAAISAMFATFNVVPTKAPEFWTPVFDGTGLDTKTDPRYQLREVLLRLAQRNQAASDRRLLTSEELYRISISAWNKWRRGETLVTTIRPTKDRQKPV